MRLSGFFLSLLLLLIAQLPLCASVESKLIAFNDDLLALSTDTLLDIGIDYLKREEGDSAMAYFRIVADRYTPGMSKSDVGCCLAALNNCGLIYDSWYHDYTHSYMCYRRALEICNQEHMPVKSTYAYHNMGAMFAMYADLVNSENIGIRSESFFLQAIDISIRERVWHLLTGATENFLNLAWDHGHLAKYTDVLSRIDTLSIPSDFKELEHLRQLCSAFHSVIQGNYAQAREHFRASHYAPIDSSKYRSRDFAINWIGDVAQTFMCEQRYDSALHYLQRLDSLSQLIGFYENSEYCAHQMSVCYDKLGDPVQAELNYVRYLKLKDSILYKANLSEVGELQFMYELQTVDEQMALVQKQKRQREQLLIFMCCVALIIVSLLVILFIKNHQLKERNRQLYLRSVEMLKSEQVQRHAVRQTTVTPESEMEDLCGSIDKVMNNPELICASDFSLDTLSSLVGSKPRYVSEAINKTYGKSFSILLSDQRIKIACRLMQDVEHYGHLTIEAISLEIGIKSRSTFTSAFKRVTGLTPSEYMRQARKG